MENISIVKACTSISLSLLVMIRGFIGGVQVNSEHCTGVKVNL